MAGEGPTSARELPRDPSTGPSPEGDALARLAGIVEEQQRQIAALAEAFGGTTRGPGTGSHGEPEQRGGELPWRFDAHPKWLDASGWKDQSDQHRRAWPVLRRLLQLERWTGALVRVTFPQLADYLCVSEDTAKRWTVKLAGWGVIEYEAGAGRTSSTVRILHPIKSPVPYGEVPWRVGGLGEGTPGGHLEGLRGSKRHYAELYGVVFEEPERDATADEGEPESSPEDAGETPDRGGEAGRTLGASPGGSAGTEDLESGSEPSAENAAPGFAGAGGAPCPPLDTLDSPVLRSSHSPPDAGAREAPKAGGKEGKKARIDDVIEELRSIPPSDVGEEAIDEARRVLDALGVSDASTAARTGQLAAYALLRGERWHLREANKHIRRAREGGVRIASPIRYAIAALLDQRRKAALKPEEAELGRLVLAGEGPHTRGACEERRRSADDRKRGYEWLFDERPKDVREGYEWFFDTPTREEKPAVPPPERGDVEEDGAEGAEAVPDEEELLRRAERRRSEEREAREKVRLDRGRVAGLFADPDELGEDMRRLLLRVREGRLPRTALHQRVALELAPGDPGAVVRYWAAVEGELEHGEDQA